MLHQVGVSVDLYYDARKHKIKMYYTASGIITPVGGRSCAREGHLQV